MSADKKPSSDRRDTLTDDLAAQLAAQDKTYRERAAAAARLDAELTRGAA